MDANGGTSDGERREPVLRALLRHGRGITYNVPNNPGWPNAGATISIPSGVRPCSAYGVGIYDGSVTFNGVAYTNDQILAVRQPAVQRHTAPRSRALPTHHGLPGQLERGAGSTAPATYIPQGWVDDFYDGCGGTPIWGSGVYQRRTTRGLAAPSVDDGRPHLLRRRDQDERLPLHRPDDDRVRKGRHDERLEPPYAEHGAEPHIRNRGQLRHLQPLDGHGQPGPWQTGIPVPSSNPSLNQSGVIYVQSEQPTGTGCSNCGYQTPPAVSTVDPTHLALPTGATCINPYYYNLAANSPQCTEGDAIVEGELQGQVTLATSADIIVSRDLTYQCADGSGGATTTDPSSVAACNSCRILQRCPRPAGERGLPDRPPAGPRRQL